MTLRAFSPKLAWLHSSTNTSTYSSTGSSPDLGKTGFLLDPCVTTPVVFFLCKIFQINYLTNWIHQIYFCHQLRVQVQPLIVTSQRKTSLRFVIWNTNGIKYPPEKFVNVRNILRHLRADVAFIQETHVGTQCVKILQNVPGWRSYFTVHSSRSKGVAILIKNSVPFEYICCDEDCCGGYIVLFCHLYGELYTLVNVYNHKEDRNVLGRLKEYLLETAEGVLVVGGDFNTLLNPNIDRKPSSTRHSPLKPILQDFTESLMLIDTWSQKHSDTETENRFTRKQGESSSRLDMFFLQEAQIQRMTKIEVKAFKKTETFSMHHHPLVLKLQCQMQSENRFTRKQGESSSKLDIFFRHEDQKQRLKEIEVKIESISDHYPLVLELQSQMQLERKLPKIVTSLEKSEYNSDRRAGKISGAEILSAIKSLPEKYRQDHWILLTETLKPSYNDMLKSHKVLENFKMVQGSHEFTREYLIFSEVLAKRLNAYLSLETKCNICVVIIVIFKSRKQKIRWSFLKSRFEELKNDKLKQAPFVPPANFSILDSLLPKTQSTSGDLRDLQPGCPLTSAVLYLALHKLNLMVCDDAVKTIVCYHKQTLIIHAQQDKQKQIGKIVETFQYESSVRLIVQYP
ncbi:uncharacterized protein LOC125140843 [Tachysurus fulvidraco]|uniref:uncharacterized protein LOC125140843 n=1 Tax=Tachysurus fulvidraco TaxID=1234273 RepID=UPI001FEEFE34|nr:uncharacterized protein LOC125140843 [Tachysurus fulvidraco]